MTETETYLKLLLEAEKDAKKGDEAAEQQDTWAEQSADFYRAAADKILAAKVEYRATHVKGRGPSQGEPKELSNRESARIMGRGHTWVNDLLTWVSKSGRNASTFAPTVSPYAGKYEEQKQRAVKKAIKELTDEEITALALDRGLAPVVKKAAKEKKDADIIDLPQRKKEKAAASSRSDLRREVDLLGLGKMAGKSAMLGRQCLEALVGEDELDDEKREFLLHQVEQAVQTWQIVKEQIENPVAAAAEAFLAESNGL
jgi:hypothetical protein